MGFWFDERGRGTSLASRSPAVGAISGTVLPRVVVPPDFDGLQRIDVDGGPTPPTNMGRDLNILGIDLGNNTIGIAVLAYGLYRVFKKKRIGTMDIAILIAGLYMTGLHKQLFYSSNGQLDLSRAVGMAFFPATASAALWGLGGLAGSMLLKKMFSRPRYRRRKRTYTNYRRTYRRRYYRRR